MGLISWIVFGALAGWVANLLVDGERKGCMTNIIIGVLGAFVGGLIMQLLGFGGTNFGWDWRSFGVAVLGAIILLAVSGRTRRRD